MSTVREVIDSAETSNTLRRKLLRALRHHEEVRELCVTLEAKTGIDAMEIPELEPYYTVLEQAELVSRDPPVARLCDRLFPLGGGVRTGEDAT